jgi:hypothetical protein
MKAYNHLSFQGVIAIGVQAGLGRLSSRRGVDTENQRTAKVLASQREIFFAKI